MTKPKAWSPNCKHSASPHDGLTRTRERRRMNKQEEKRRVLIFGGAGFIGANLARYLLLETGARVHIFDNLSRRGVQHNLQQLKTASGKSGRLRITIGDVRDAAAVERCVRDATEIYQFAAQVA